MLELRLRVYGNRQPEEEVKLGNFSFQKAGNIMEAVTKISESTVGVEGFPPVVDIEVERKALNNAEEALLVLSFSTDGVFRVDPNRMAYVSPNGKRFEGFLEDWVHPREGRLFKLEECKYAEGFLELLKDDFLKRLFKYYSLGLELAYGCYYLEDAFLNFFKVVENISGRMNKELKLRELINRKPKTRDRVEFACKKLDLSDLIDKAKKLVETRGIVAHSTVEWIHLIDEVRTCREVSRKFLLRYLILHNFLPEEGYSNLLKFFQSGVL